jgi:hypothetical protein
MPTAVMMLQVLASAVLNFDAAAAAAAGGAACVLCVQC